MKISAAGLFLFIMSSPSLTEDLELADVTLNNPSNFTKSQTRTSVMISGMSSNLIKASCEAKKSIPCTFRKSPMHACNLSSWLSSGDKGIKWLTATARLGGVISGVGSGKGLFAS